MLFVDPDFDVTVWCCDVKSLVAVTSRVRGRSTQLDLICLLLLQCLTAFSVDSASRLFHAVLDEVWHERKSALIPQCN